MSDKPLTAAVVDVSIVVKWLLPEPDSDAAVEQRRQWEANGLVPVAPDFLLIELHNVLWKKIQRNELAPEAPILISAPTFGLDLSWFPFEPLLPLAWNFASRCHVSMYDALYAALAHQLHASFYTADTKLAERIGHVVSVNTLSSSASAR